METKTRDTPDLSNPVRNSKLRPKKILIIQSASRVFKKTLESLRNEFPEATFTILTAHPDEMKDSLVGSADYQILPLPEGKHISIFSYGIGKRKYLHEQNFDLAAVLYNIEKGWGYANVESLAWSTGAKEIRGYFPAGTFKHLTLSQIFKNRLREQTAIGWVALNILTAFIQLVIVGFSMAGEAGYRRIFAKRSSSTKPKGSSE
ncbi:MAG: hypothetical protein G3M70_00405 [Candidatus Nitronauta litoralis]|uniref:Uncharacterized protein n=1 Tax=Candidatus Nitronauta litoralis TaxID=2705533 RepID=A0A7T0BSZ5_9BACT|nr:MAG: hypothetical protein G3M70_00405 [Candidatus Nitronauta litoralis]